MNIHVRMRRLAATILGLAMLSGGAVFAVAQSQVGGDRGGPSYKSSIQVDREFRDQSEAAYLASKAKLTLAQAVQSVATVHPAATVLSAGLENENGSLVFAIDVSDTTKGTLEVVVDAGNGKILGENMGSSERQGFHGEGRSGEEANRSAEGEHSNNAGD